MESIYFRIIDGKGLKLLEAENEALDDPEEREAREKLIDAIHERITEYDVHVREYAYKQTVKKLLGKGIGIEPVDRAALVSEWDKTFDALVSAEQKASAKHYSDQFRWHLFSFELLSAATEKAAMELFDAQQKGELYLFFDYDDRAFEITNGDLLSAQDIEKLEENSPLDLKDMYFYSPKGKWVYIRPHEDYCGPYFFQA